MMGAMFIFALAIAYLYLVYQVVKRVPRWAKPLIIISAFLTVTADGYLGRKKLEKMCEEQGGLHIYRTVEGVEGVEIMYGYPDVSMIKNYGYTFIEGWGTRLEWQQNGMILERKNIAPKSLYQIAYSTNSIEHKYYYTFSAEILDRENSIIIASYKSFGYKGGWIERFINGLYASESPTVLCPKIDFDNFSFWDNNLITKILKPIETEK